MLRSWTIALVMPLGCAERTGPAPARVDPAAHCAQAIVRARELAPAERYGVVALDCLVPMLHEPICREAVVRSVSADPATRASSVTHACASAYCPRLGAPRPALCTRNLATVPPSELLPLAGELFARVRVLELGAAEVKRWEELVGAAPWPTSVTVTPAPAPEPVGLRVRMTLRDEALVIAVGSESWRLPSKPVATDFDPPAERVAQLIGDPDAPLILEADPSLPYDQLVGMLNALAVRHIHRITLATTTN